MEASEQFSNESCSYRWLMHIKSSLDPLGDSHRSFDTQDGSSFIEMDPDCISMCWTIDANVFDFDLPISQSSVLDHPDQIFSSGLLQLPLQVTSPPRCEVSYLDPVLDSSISLNSSRPLVSSSSSTVFHSAHNSPKTSSVASRNAKFKSHITRHCAGSLKKILWRYLCFLMPLYERVKGLRVISPKSVKSCLNLVGSSRRRRRSNAFSSIELCNSNTDISIYDAIIHCKNSNVRF